MRGSLTSSLGIFIIDRQFPFGTLGAGSGVCVWRDEKTQDAYVATAAHVVAGNDYRRTSDQITIILVDLSNRKYVNPSVVVMDVQYDYCLLKIPGNTSLVPVTIDLRDEYLTGDACYTIGFPFGLDANSVSSGVIRSSRWTQTGTIENILISAPVMFGNSGGGVFTTKNDFLIGLVSWIIQYNYNPVWTFAGVISAYIIRESLYFLMYSRTVEFPVKAYAKQYFLGIHGRQMVPVRDVHVYQLGHPALAGRAVMGMKIQSVLKDSPADLAGLRSYSSVSLKGAIFESYDIIWAVSFDLQTWNLITEEQTLSRILHEKLQNPQRFWLPHRAIHVSNQSEKDLLISTFDTELSGSQLVLYALVSSVINNAHGFLSAPVGIRIDGLSRMDEDLTLSPDGHAFINNQMAQMLPQSLTVNSTDLDDSYQETTGTGNYPSQGG